MMIDPSVLSDALNGYLDGKVVERGFRQSLDQETRAWLSRAIYVGIRSLPDQLTDVFGRHQLKNVFARQTKEIAFGCQL